VPASFRADDPNPATDIQELCPSSGQREVLPSMTCGSVRPRPSVAPQVALRHLAIELHLTTN